MFNIFTAGKPQAKNMMAQDQRPRYFNFFKLLSGDTVSEGYLSVNRTEELDKCV